MKKLFSKDLDSINIKDIGIVSTGKTPSSFDKSLWNGRTPFVTPGDISGSKYVINTERTVSDKGSKVATQLPRNSLMVVCIGSTIGKVALTSKDMITNQQLNSIIINEDKFDANFIYYSFLNSSNLFKALAGTAAVPIINKTLFEKFKISFISDKKEQTRIGDILSNLDEKILLQQRRKVKLEKIKQGLMDDLLTGKKRVKIN
jgi:type I restriction enzyme S subunit